MTKLPKPIEAPEWLKQRMLALRKLPAQTWEKIQLQYKKSMECRARFK